MKRVAVIGGILHALVLGGFAQTPDDYNEGSRLEWDSANSIWRFKWWGRQGRTYFIQHTEDLQSWLYVPAIESGNDSVREWGFTSTGDKFFVRLKCSDVPTSDPANADFDGDGVPNLFEVQNGFNPFGLVDVAANGMPDEWEIFNSGKFAIWPPSLTVSIPRNQTADKTIYLRNDTASPVQFSVALSGNTGPAYSFEDSLTGGAVYEWEEISATGQLLSEISSADDSAQEVVLTGFSFPLFGTSYSSLFVSSNGFVSFGAQSSSYSNVALPSPSAPRPIIAPLWDDLNPGSAGDVFFFQDSTHAVVQFEAVSRYGGGGTYTFQVALYSDGQIQFRYKTMSGTLDSATVGLQDAAGLIGLQMAFNQAYLSDRLSIDISPQSVFLTASPVSGTVPAFTTLGVNATFHSLSLPFGTCNATITTSHDAPFVAGPYVTSATLEVINTPSVVSMTSPATGTVTLEGNDVQLAATATDVDGVQKVEFYRGTEKVGEALSSPYEFYWSNPPVGTHVLTAKAIDVFGDATSSSPVSITALPDADRDSLPDGWEAENGLSNTDFSDALGDADADRIPNLWEYRHGTDPNDPLARAPTARVVASNGSGDHLTLQEAYDAASDGEIIEVREGTYQGISAWGSKRIVWLAAPANPASTVQIAPTYPAWASIEAYSDSAFDGFAIKGHGGIVAYTSQARVVFTNCRLSDGTGDYAPGAVKADDGSTVVLRHCTVINNRCKNYGYSWGANAVYVGWNSRLAVQNSILWNINANGLPEVQSDGTVTVASSIIGGGQYGAANQDPSLAFGGWITAGSPGLDAGLALGSTRDAQGELRPAGPAPDLGWDEFRDADSDGLPDWLEDLGATNPTADHDSDGLTNIAEYQTHGTSILSADSDGDGLYDGLEVLTHGTNPLAGDSDSDGMPDGWEITHSLDPLGDDASADSDGDSLTNFWEYTWGFDPADPSDAYRDSDNDGLPDWWEITHYGHPSNATDSADTDSDGLTNLQEYQYATNPRNWDTDGDLLPDAWEVQYDLDPNSYSGIHGADGDQDGDGLSNFQEMIHGSNPGAADTDGDGVSDGGEVSQGSNPNDPGDGGQAPPAEELVDIPFSVGDPSGSHSERWKMNIQANGPDDTRQFGFVSPDFGEMGTQNFKLRKGNSYTITISHVATNIEEGGPDYDWEAKTGGLPGGDGDQAINHYFVVGNAWVADNSQGLLTTEKHGDDQNIAQGRQARLHPLKFVTPAGDPVANPSFAGTNPTSIPDGANEFVFNDAHPGALHLLLKAEIVGMSQIPQDLAARFAFSVDGIGNSALAWDQANPQGVAEVNNSRLQAKATFTNLPALNSDFGLKTARLLFDGADVTEAKFEVFYLATATNHPPTQDPADFSEGDTPNVFFYSVQILRPGNGYTPYVPFRFVTGITQPSVDTQYQEGVGWGYPMTLGGGQFYIDPVGAIAHENQHIYNHFVTVWGSQQIKQSGDDSDADDLKDSWETSKWGNLLKGWQEFVDEYDEPLAQEAPSKLPKSLRDDQSWKVPGPNL